MQRYANPKLHILVVWEPILSSDWRPPSGSTMRRIPDSRARQFWDHDHLLSQVLMQFKAKKPDQPEPECCVRNGFHWDEAILYAPGSRWRDRPSPVFWDGAVDPVMRRLENAVRELK